MKAFDNQTTTKILLSVTNKKTDEEKCLYIFAGPNGSGKSTLIANCYVNGKLECPYINADLNCITKFSEIEDENQRNERAMFYTIEQVKNLIKEGKSFCYETVLSHPSKLEMMKSAKNAGFKIKAVFVYTKSPEINIERVKMRALQGGHDVPVDKIEKRYYRSLENSKILKEIADEFFMFDNSQTLIIEKCDEEML